jgi:hypothetical protein
VQVKFAEFHVLLLYRLLEKVGRGRGSIDKKENRDILYDMAVSK